MSGAEPPGTITSTINIRDMLRDVKNVASKHISMLMAVKILCFINLRYE